MAVCLHTRVQGINTKRDKEGVRETPRGLAEETAQIHASKGNNRRNEWPQMAFKSVERTLKERWQQFTLCECTVCEKVCCLQCCIHVLSCHMFCNYSFSFSEHLSLSPITQTHTNMQTCVYTHTHTHTHRLLMSRNAHSSLKCHGSCLHRGPLIGRLLSTPHLCGPQSNNGMLSFPAMGMLIQRAREVEVNSEKGGQKSVGEPKKECNCAAYASKSTQTSD